MSFIIVLVLLNVMLLYPGKPDLFSIQKMTGLLITGAHTYLRHLCGVSLFLLMRTAFINHIHQSVSRYQIEPVYVLLCQVL